MRLRYPHVLTLAGVAVLAASTLATSQASATPTAAPTPTAPPTAGSAQSAAAQDVARQIRVLRDPAIVESSGLARSQYSRDVLWTHNDSGGGPRLFSIGPDGSTIGTFQVAGAPARDWEAMASARPRRVGYLFAGDIGDNRRQRSTILVHRVREPAPGATGGTLPARTYQLAYPDGAHNAETLMVKPKSMRIVVVTKDARSGAIYVAPRSLSTTRVNVMRKVVAVPQQLSDGVYLDRRRFVLRGGHNRAYLYQNLRSQPTVFTLPTRGESVTRGWGPTVLIGSEGKLSQVWQVPLP